MAILCPANSYRCQNGKSGARPCTCPFPNSSFFIHSTSLLLTQRFPTTNRVLLSYPLQVRYPSLSLSSSTGRCSAASSEPPPPPPESDPPPDLSRVSGKYMYIYIFFMYMSLLFMFFWFCVLEKLNVMKLTKKFQRTLERLAEEFLFSNLLCGLSWYWLVNQELCS